MLSDLKKKKLTRQFQIFDVDKNHFVEWSDFERIIKNLTAARGLPADAQAVLRSNYQGVWDNIESQADKNNDHRVSLEEWMNAHEVNLADDEGFKQVMGGLVDLLIGLFDTNGDGLLEPDDYRLFYKVYEIKDGLEQGIEKIFPDGRSLSRDGVSAVVRDFFMSDNPDAAGNWLFGPF
jgi:hypothetical protein